MTCDLLGSEPWRGYTHFRAVTTPCPQAIPTQIDEWHALKHVPRLNAILHTTFHMMSTLMRLFLGGVDGGDGVSDGVSDGELVGLGRRIGGCLCVSVLLWVMSEVVVVVLNGMDGMGVVWVVMGSGVGVGGAMAYILLNPSMDHHDHDDDDDDGGEEESYPGLVTLLEQMMDTMDMMNTLLDCIDAHVCMVRDLPVLVRVYLCVGTAGLVSMWMWMWIESVNGSRSVWTIIMCIWMGWVVVPVVMMILRQQYNAEEDAMRRKRGQVVRLVWQFERYFPGIGWRSHLIPSIDPAPFIMIDGIDGVDGVECDTWEHVIWVLNHGRGVKWKVEVKVEMGKTDGNGWIYMNYRWQSESASSSHLWIMTRKRVLLLFAA